MKRSTLCFPTAGLACAMLLAACGSKVESPAGAGDVDAAPVAVPEEKVLNLYVWNYYLGPDTVANFEKETGIKVFLSNYSSNEELESKLAPGHSSHDVVVPSASFYERQIRGGYYRKLDKSKLPNLSHMDPDILARMAMQDPGNEHAVLHAWGTTGVGYNVAKVKAAAPDAPLDSWQLVFEPANAKRLQKCGIAVLESASEMFFVTLRAIGRDPNSQKSEDIEAAAAALMRIRPYIRYIDTDRILPGLANGEICVTVGYIGDILQGRNRARESNTGQEIAYFIPREGSIMWFDSYLIPKDAPHPGNAHAFLNYIRRPEVIAGVTNAINYANGNKDAARFVNKAVLDEPGIYPPPQVRAKLVPVLANDEQTTRRMTRLWTRFMTGR